MSKRSKKAAFAARERFYRRLVRGAATDGGCPTGRSSGPPSAARLAPTLKRQIRQAAADYGLAPQPKPPT
jgi:hypothetical protein